MDDNRSRAWFFGVHWASQDHHAVVVDAIGRKLGERGFRHGGEGLTALAAWITSLTEVGHAYYANRKTFDQAT